jgi:hypothetical protein
MDVELPDGTVVENVPDGISKADLARKLAANGYDISWYKPDSKPTPEVIAKEKPDPSLMERIRNLLPSQVVGRQLNMMRNTGDIVSPEQEQSIRDTLAGGASLPLGAINTVGGLFGNNKIVDTSQVRGNPVDKSSTSYMAGTLLDPASQMVGAGAFKAAKVLPIGQIGQGIVGGAGSGAAIGGLSENGSAIEGAKWGGLLGGAVPTFVAAKQWIAPRANEIANLFRSKGAENIANSYINERIGDANKPSVINALNNSREIVPGSLPTAEQALAGVPGGSPVQAHQSLVAKESGGPSAVFGQRAMDQQAAREAALSFAGTEDDVARLVAERTNAVKPFYDAVKTSTASVKSSPVLNQVNELIAENKNNTKIAVPLAKIRDALVLRTDKGAILESSPQALKSLSDDIGNMMSSKRVDGSAEFDVKTLRAIKESLDKQIGLAEPAYQKALDTFHEMSKPINVMQVGQALKSKLTNATGNETPGTFLRALSNEKKLLKDSIGFGRTTVDEILGPENMNSVNRVTADLERSVLAKNPAQRTDLRGGINVATESTPALPNLLYRPAMIVNKVLKMGGKNIEPEIDAYLTRLYTNPKELGRVLQSIEPAKRAQFNSIVQSAGRASVVNALEQRDNQ